MQPLRKDPVEAAGLLLQEGHVGEAETLLRAALRRNPQDHRALANMGVAARLRGDFEAAKRYALAALTIDGNSAITWNNLGMVDEDLGDWNAALASYRAAHDRDLRSQQIQINLAYALMRLGQFDEAWPLWESGRLMRSWVPIPGIPILEPGDNLSWPLQKRVLVLREGGYGDGILFSRWLPLLAQRGARVTFVTWRRLASLLATQDWQHEITFADDQAFSATPGQYDFQCGLMSLPWFFGMRQLADVASLFRPWQADFDRSVNWRNWLMSHSVLPLRVGICWRAEEHGTPRPHRSIPIKALAPLGRVEGVSWVSLCPSGLNLHRELAPEATPDWMIDPPVDLSTWDDTAALVASLDLVVTVDTSIAHLAGALGVPTWLLLSLRGDWKWPPRESDETPWYPSVLIVRQEKPEKWRPVILAVRDMLQQLRHLLYRRKKA